MSGLQALISACLLVLVSLAFADVDPSEGPPPALGQVVPDFTLQRIDGGDMRLSDVREPVVVLNIFAFWCDTWIAELPQLRELVASEQALGFKLISVSIDGRWPDQLQQVCGDNPPPWPILLDTGRILGRGLTIRHAPTVLVLDRTGRVRYAWEGYPGNPNVLRGIRLAASKHAAD